MIGDPIKDIPEGCLPSPGYIVEVFAGSAWLTQDSKVTPHWHQRGIWATPQDAAEAAKKAIQE